MRQCRTEEVRLRNRAMLPMLYETGTRIAEVCQLHDEQVDLTERTGHILHGKGNKYRYVFWGIRTASALDRYLAVRHGETGGPLFRGVGSKCTTPNAPITANTARLTIKKLAKY